MFIIFEDIPPPTRDAQLFAIRQAEWTADEYKILAARSGAAATDLTLAVECSSFPSLAQWRAEAVDIRDGMSRMIENIDIILARANQETRR